jgi:carbohydrate kinase (thermoresistant glucokinase family)
MVIVVMGATGAGKTTVGSLLAGRLGWTVADADDFHSAANVDKMRAGIALDDADRGPWIEALGGAIESWLAKGEDVVLACSALKRSYRERLTRGPGVTFVYLKGAFEEIEARLDTRRGHFAGKNLLRSQFEELEEPAVDENAIAVSLGQTPGEIVTEVARRLGLDAASAQASEEDSE